jgi:hypothetical protein
MKFIGTNPGHKSTVLFNRGNIGKKFIFQKSLPSNPNDNVLFDTSSFVGTVPEPYLTALNTAAARWSNYIQFDPTIVQAIRTNIGDEENPVYGAPHGGTFPIYSNLSNWNGIKINSFNTINTNGNYIAACAVSEYIDIINPDYSSNVKFNTFSFDLYINLYYTTGYISSLRPNGYNSTDWANILAHELGHALGIGIYWRSDPYGYLGANPPQNFFLSSGSYKSAGTAYNSILEQGGRLPQFYTHDNIKRPKIPLESAGEVGGESSHWENNFRSSDAAGANSISYPGVPEEIMSAFYTTTNPLLITDLSLKVLVDFGYVEKNPGVNEGLPLLADGFYIT